MANSRTRLPSLLILEGQTSVWAKISKISKFSKIFKTFQNILDTNLGSTRGWKIRSTVYNIPKHQQSLGWPRSNESSDKYYFSAPLKNSEADSILNAASEKQIGSHRDSLYHTEPPNCKIQTTASPGISGKSGNKPFMAPFFFDFLPLNNYFRSTLTVLSLLGIILDIDPLLRYKKKRLLSRSRCYQEAATKN